MKNNMIFSLPIILFFHASTFCQVDSVFNNQTMGSLFKKSGNETLIPKYDTSYFYTTNGEFDSLKVLSDTALHWGGYFFYDDNPDFSSRIYGQSTKESNGRIRFIGKCLGFIDTYSFRDEYGVVRQNLDKNRVTLIMYFNDEGILLKAFNLGYFSRKIIGCWQ